VIEAIVVLLPTLPKRLPNDGMIPYLPPGCFCYEWLFISLAPKFCPFSPLPIEPVTTFRSPLDRLCVCLCYEWWRM